MLAETIEDIAAAHPDASTGALARAILEARGTPLEDFLREVHEPSWDVVDVLADRQALSPRLAERFAWLLGGTGRWWLDWDAARRARPALDVGDRVLHLAQTWASQRDEHQLMRSNEVPSLIARLVSVARSEPFPRRRLTPPPPTGEIPLLTGEQLTALLRDAPRV